MTDAVFIDGTGAVLAGIFERQRKIEAAKKRTWKHRAVAAGVALAHFLVILLMLEARIAVAQREKPVKDQPLLWLLLPRATQAPQDFREQQAAELVRQAYKAIQLLPQIEQQERPSAITIDPGLSLGQALSCGAGSFEYLTPEGRRRCRDVPWGFRYDRYGYLVMDMNRRSVPVEKPRPSDVMAHQRNTQEVCPRNIDPNAPCLGRIIHGNGPL